MTPKSWFHLGSFGGYLGFNLGGLGGILAPNWGVLGSSCLQLGGLGSFLLPRHPHPQLQEEALPANWTDLRLAIVSHVSGEPRFIGAGYASTKKVRERVAFAALALCVGKSSVVKIPPGYLMEDANNSPPW